MVFDISSLSGQTPFIARYLDEVLEAVIELHASDLFLEPQEAGLSLRYRRFGEIIYYSTVPPSLASALAAHIKSRALLDAANHRVPQDGRMHFVHTGRDVDLRVATTPTQFGENITIRILDRKRSLLKLDALGMPPLLLNQLRQSLKYPQGLLIIAGPTGSGKTTTLYSILQELNTEDRKILSVEDPVEYLIEGLVQVPVHRRLSFAQSLKAFLRQDPDILVVGEVRDFETAQIAFQAAFTGHLVLTTLHAPDAPSAMARLVDLGLSPRLIAAGLQGVLAQRLMPEACEACSTHKTEGCSACRGTGTQAQRAVFDFLEGSSGDMMSSFYFSAGV